MTTLITLTPETEARLMRIGQCAGWTMEGRAALGMSPFEYGRECDPERSGRALIEIVRAEIHRAHERAMGRNPDVRVTIEIPSRIE